MTFFSYALEKYNTMVFLKTFLSRASRRGALLALALLVASPTLRADDLQEAARLSRAGQSQQALEQINRFLAVKPHDMQARFMKGTILAELGNSKEAADIFLKLTQDYPELPEPYNNLAVLYAAQGQYDKARAALEQSLRTHPSYATAYENLSGIYAKLATQAYDKALQLDTAGTSSSSNKLALVHELVPVASRAAQPVAVAVASASATASDAAPVNGIDVTPAADKRTVVSGAGESGAAKEKTVVAAVKPAVPAASTPLAAPSSQQVVSPPQAVQAPHAAPQPRVAPSQVAASSPQAVPTQRAAPSPQSEVVETVRAWAAAWSKKDAKAYLAFYAKEFKTPRGEPRASWEQARRARITAPKSISVTILSPRVEVRGDSKASVRFRQSYRSDVFTGNSSKSLTLVKSDGRWLIMEESVN
jgi:hypothetical protein